ncbi:hypothetical protein Tsubulata_011194 [Turnera subulata]|uniref:C3H1-type domain-containing protein n=1 Tax=Turnera subulata TaxID=218843 RepID=A0A9Q0J2H5_9ROSI|nr:hypothetical protein Tsubulata_011194 [Turnera subulata]
MNGSSRKRNSKWDLKEESRMSFENIQDSAWSGKSGSSFHEKESQRGRSSPEAAGSNRTKWSAVDAADSFHGRRGSRRDDALDEDRNRSSKSVTSWERNESYGTRMSPGLEEWRHQGSHQSPKSEWKRSRRSRSRSRSRSKSPVNSFRRESGAYDRSTSRSGYSAQICRDFPSGRCRRGSQCPFLHQGGHSYDDDWERQRKPVAFKYPIPNDSKEYSLGSGRSAHCCTDFLKGNCRRGASCRYAHDNTSEALDKGPANEMIRERDSERRHRYLSPDRVGEREVRRASDVPCKFFAAGNCRNGKYCRFSHNSQTHLSPEKRSRDGRWPVGQKSDDVEKSWNAPSGTDRSTSSDALLSKDTNEKLDSERRHTGMPMNDEWAGKNRTHDDLSMIKAVERVKREPLQWKPENTGDIAHVPEEKARENWPGDMDMSPDWNYRVQPSNNIGKRDHASFPGAEPNMTTGQVQNHSAIIPQMINETSSTQKDSQLGEFGVPALLHNDNVALGTKASPHMNLAANVLSARSFSQSSLGSNALPLPSLHLVGQSREPVLADPSRGGGIIDAQNHTLFREDKNITKLNNGDSNALQVNSGALNQNTVSGEQLNRLTNLSASLAQLLANGQQLPQLYAAHNSQNGGDTDALSSGLPEGPIKPDTVVTMQPNQAGGSQKQYDPICDSVEPEKHEVPLSSQRNIVEQKNISDSTLPMLTKDASTPSLAGAMNGGKHNKFHGSLLLG